MQTTLNPKKKKRKRGGSWSQLPTHNQFPLRKQETLGDKRGWCERCAKVATIMNLVQGSRDWNLFHPGSSCLGVQANQTGELLVADSSSNGHSWHSCISPRASASSAHDHPNTKTLGLWEHPIKHHAYHSQTCPPFVCIHSSSFFCDQETPVRSLLLPPAFSALLSAAFHATAWMTVDWTLHFTVK